LKEKTKKLGLQDKFTFLGQVDKDRLITLYQNATIFILPSYHEGLPTVILEAMACGLPVIATRVRGNQDLVSTGENGILVLPNAPKKLAEAISMLLADEELRKKIVKNARKTIEEKYTWDIISDNILKCYSQLLEDTR
jgi:glycosyltransferase involved in cell wall biosynthesis